MLASSQSFAVKFVSYATDDMVASSFILHCGRLRRSNNIWISELNILKNEASAIFLDGEFQRFTYLSVKKCLLIFVLNDQLLALRLWFLVVDKTSTPHLSFKPITSFIHYFNVITSHSSKLKKIPIYVLVQMGWFCFFFPIWSFYIHCLFLYFCETL